MLKRRKKRPAPGRSGGNEAADGTLLLLAALFLFGCLLGSLLSGDGAKLSSRLQDLPASAWRSDFWQAFFDYAKYALAAFLLGTTTCGVAALPLLCVWKGFVYSRTAAAAIVQNGGISAALLAPGLPAVLSIACFLVLSADGFQNARRLCGLVKGAHLPPVRLRLAHAAVCLPFLFGGAAVAVYLVPILTNLFH